MRTVTALKVKQFEKSCPTSYSNFLSCPSEHYILNHEYFCLFIASPYQVSAVQLLSFINPLHDMLYYGLTSIPYKFWPSDQ